MAKPLFSCPKCSRKFSMKAHLVRHLTAGHGGPKPAGGAKRGRPAGKSKAMAVAAFSQNGVSDIVTSMLSYQSQLSAKRLEIDNQISALATALEALNVSAPAPRATAVRRGRPPKAKRGRPAMSSSAGGAGGGGRRLPGSSLRDYVLTVLRGASKPMGVKDIGDSVMKAGYPTAAKDLSKAVSNLIAKLKEVKKVDRGLYRA